MSRVKLLTGNLEKYTSLNFSDARYKVDMHPGGSGSFIAIRPSSRCGAILPSSRKTWTVVIDEMYDLQVNDRNSCVNHDEVIA